MWNKETKKIKNMNSPKMDLLNQFISLNSAEQDQLWSPASLVLEATSLVC